MAYTFGNKCAKNLCKRIVLLQLIIENVVTCFFGTQCRMIWLPYGERSMTIIYVVFIMLSRFHLIPECYGRTDGQTDRQTDGQTDRFTISI